MPDFTAGAPKIIPVQPVQQGAPQPPAVAPQPMQAPKAEEVVQHVYKQVFADKYNYAEIQGNQLQYRWYGTCKACAWETRVPTEDEVIGALTAHISAKHGV